MPCALHLELLAGTADFIEAAPPITDGQVAAWIKLEHRFAALDKEKTYKTAGYPTTKTSFYNFLRRPETKKYPKISTPTKQPSP